MLSEISLQVATWTRPGSSRRRPCTTQRLAVSIRPCYWRQGRTRGPVTRPTTPRYTPPRPAATAPSSGSWSPAPTSRQPTTNDAPLFICRQSRVMSPVWKRSWKRQGRSAVRRWTPVDIYRSTIRHTADTMMPPSSSSASTHHLSVTPQAKHICLKSSSSSSSS